MAKENDEVNGVKRTALIAIASAFLGGAGGPVLLLKFSDGEMLRPDPFTGSQGKALERRLVTLESENDAAHAVLERHIVSHPDVLNNYDRRITTLEVQYANIIANQEKIIDRLDRAAK